jgi:hypothetical protein
MKIIWIVFITMVLSTYYSFGQYLDPTIETNINKVDPLFERSMDDYNGFKQGIESDRERYIEGIKSSKGSDDLTGFDQIKQEKGRLENIDANNLQGAGRVEVSKDPFYDEMYGDHYSKPGMKAHLEDAKLIAESSGKMMGSLLGALKELGVDCKTVKGNQESEPQYFMQFEQKKDRNKGETIYDQYFCERPQNQYICKDELTVTCKTKGAVFGEWEDGSISISRHDIDPSWTQPATMGEYYGKHDHWRVDYDRIREEDPTVQFHLKDKVAVRLNILNKEQIGDPIMVGYRENEGKRMMGYIIGKGIKSVGDANSLNFKYREATSACLEWQESWNERCRLTQ